jgi:hypothetical protein
VPLELNPGFLRAPVLWHIEISKQAPGIDFFAKFLVPVYDTPHAPAAEQRPD